MKLAALVPILCVACLHVMAQTVCPQPHLTAKYAGPVSPGHVLEHSNPDYPSSAKSRGISGSVTFRAHILEDGTVGHLTVLSGPPELQEAAKKTLYRWRFSPWTANGQPVDAYTTLPVTFNLPRPDGSVGPPPRPVGQKIPAIELQGLLVRSYPAKRPKEAVKSNIFGTITLHVVLDEAGRIADLGVVCGPEELEDAALETVRHWSYQPYFGNGHPIAVESTLEVHF
jgi:TonB family protein